MDKPFEQSPSPAATGLRIAPNGEYALLVLEDGRLRRLNAETLWTECPSAIGRLRRLDRKHIPAPADLRVTAVKMIGNYGVNIAFSDGHDRGIYPWGMLAKLSAPLMSDDFLST